MFKKIITVLSILLSYNLFALERPCGTMLAGLIVSSEKLKNIRLHKTEHFNKPFCDNSKDELMANVLIELINTKTKEISTKKIYIPETIQHEVLTKNKIKNIPATQSDEQVRTIHFEIHSSGKYQYDIFKLKTNEKLSSGEINVSNL